jgi:hypothetical protein
MQELTTDLVGRACAIFLDLAYPGGETTIPPRRRVYRALPPGQVLRDFLCQSADAQSVCQTLADRKGRAIGVAIRLGSADFPHLKLKVQRLEPHDGVAEWVFGVDTHDSFSPHSPQAPAGHPEAEAWARLQRANQKLKEQVEHAWEQAGLLTFNGLLRRELQGDHLDERRP